jgi:hypothetical protein
MELYAMQTRIALCNGCDNDDVKKRLTNEAQLSISAERASETKERSRNKGYSTKLSNTREYALIDNRMVKRCDALRCDGAGVCVCDGGKPMVDGGLMMDDGDGDGDGERWYGGRQAGGRGRDCVLNLNGVGGE